MKNILMLGAAALMAGVALTGCKEDTQPRLDIPAGSTFVLHTPAMADQLYTFGANQNNQSANSITFNVSQPDYGVACTPSYQVQIARSEKDFEEYDKGNTEIIVTDEANPDAEPVKYPRMVSVGTPGTAVNIVVDGKDFCEGINTLMGYVPADFKESNPIDAIFVRVHAWIDGYPQADCWSNVVKLKAVQTYLPLTEPGKLYVIGNITGWDITNDKVFLKETEIGSGIYTGMFDAPLAKDDKGNDVLPQFRFYTALGDWEANSIGSQEADAGVELEFTGDAATGSLVEGKGSWILKGWTGGVIDAVVNLNDMTFTFKKSEGRKIYLVGQPQGWSITSDAMALSETSFGSDIYTGTFDIKAGEFQLRFYTELGNWEANSIGSQEADSPISIALDGGLYEGAAVKGKGSWQIDGFAGGKVTFTVNLVDMTVKFEAAN